MQIHLSVSAINIIETLTIIGVSAASYCFADDKRELATLIMLWAIALLLFGIFMAITSGVN